MSYQIEFANEPHYLHAIVTGLNLADNIRGYLRDVLSECVKLNADCLLIEERLDGPRLGTFEVYQIVVEGSKDALGVFKAIAFVDVNDNDGMMSFAETVAVNRGIPIRVFRQVEEAKRWLSNIDTENGVQIKEFET